MTAGRTTIWSAAGYDAWFDQPWGRYAHAVETAAVLAALRPVPGWRLLDAGCGTGRLLASMFDTGAHRIGLDRDPAMLEQARMHTTAPLLLADAGALPLGTASLDAVVAVTLLEFVSDPAAVVAEMCRVTRPGGRVVIGALNPKSPWGLAHRHRLRRPPWDGAEFLGRRQLQALARTYGPATLHGVLFVPGPVPGLSRLGPLVESLGWLVSPLGAFQVLIIERR